MLLLTGPGQATELWNRLHPALGSISVLADTQWIWLMGRSELWLSRDGVLQQVAVLPAYTRVREAGERGLARSPWRRVLAELPVATELLPYMVVHEPVPKPL